MAKLKELRKRVEFLIDDTLEEDNLIMLFNEALEDLSEAAGYEQTATTTFAAGETTIGLPTDYIKLVELRIKVSGAKGFTRVERQSVKNPGDVFEDVYPDGYYVFEEFNNGMMLFPVPKYEGEALIRYLANLPSLKPLEECLNEIEYENQVPALQARFHKMLPLYAAFRYFQNWKDEAQQVQTYQQEYYSLKNEMASEKTIKEYKNRSKTVYRYNDFM